MKAFIAVTLLAACVAAQTFDYPTGLRQHLLKKELGLTNGLWNKDVFGINKDLTFDTLRNVDTYNTVQGVNTLLSLDEIIRHPLFQTYYHLPLFRQHFTHPQFQKYLTTPYFQKFWSLLDVFPTFFRSTHLFNRFIHPIVYNTVPTTGVEYDREFDMGLNTIVGEHKNFPLNVDHVQYAHVMDKIFKHLLVNKPEILEVKTDVKIQTHPVETSFVKRVDPVTGEVKYVVDEYKNVEKRITPVEVINTIRKPVETVFDNELTNTVYPRDVNTVYGNDYTKEALLKKIFLNKVLRGERVIPEIYNWNKYDSVYPRDVNTVYGNDYTKEALLKKIWLNKILRGDRVMPEIYNMNKYENTVYPRELINTIRPVDTVYDNEILKNTLLKKMYLNKILRGERVIPEMYNYNKYESVYPRDLTHDSIFSRYPLHKYESIYPRELINKYETVLPREFETTHYPRDLINKYETVLPREFINKYESVLPRHLVNKYETENKLENILKSVVV